MERVSKDKPSSLLGLIISDEGKKFYNIDRWSQSYQTFTLFGTKQPGVHTPSNLSAGLIFTGKARDHIRNISFLWPNNLEGYT
jgi:hypothetical protein